MRLFLVLGLLLFLSACSSNNNTPPPDDDPQVTDAFTLSLSPSKENFHVEAGQTGILTIRADITQPEKVARVQVSAGSGVAYISLDPLESFLLDGASQEISVSVNPDSAAGSKPFMTLTAVGLDARGTIITEPLTQTLQWTLE